MLNRTNPTLKRGGVVSDLRKSLSCHEKLISHSTFVSRVRHGQGGRVLQLSLDKAAMYFRTGNIHSVRLPLFHDVFDSYRRTCADRLGHRHADRETGKQYQVFAVKDVRSDGGRCKYRVRHNYWI